MLRSIRSASACKHRNTRRLIFECIEARRLLAGDVSPWHNTENSLDVTGDSAVTLADSLHIFHYIEQFDEGPVPENAEPGAPFYDTNNDGLVTSADKQLVDEALARPTGGGIRQNPKNPLDVDDNDRIDRDDAREIERALASLQEPAGLSGRYWTRLFLDPDGDGSVTPADQRLISSFLSPVNTPPIARGEHNVVADSDRTLVRHSRVGLGAHDADNDPLRFILTSPPTHGTISIDEFGGYIYTPDPGYIGDDSFTYQVDDGRDSDNLSNVATATIVVRDSALNPVGHDDTYQTTSDTELAVGNGGVLANDEQKLGRIYARMVNGPQHGTLTFPIEGSDRFSGDFVYTPELGFIGTDTFTYIVWQISYNLPGEYREDPYPNRFSDVVTVRIDVGSPLQNLARPLDVNLDSKVTALDALTVINVLNAGLDGAPAEGEAMFHLCDVSGDGKITAADALAIINHLNAGFGASAGEGESAITAPDASATDELFLLLAVDAEEASAGRRKN